MNKAIHSFDTQFKWLEQQTQHTVTLERLVVGCGFSPVRQFAAFHALLRVPRRAVHVSLSVSACGSRAIRLSTTPASMTRHC